MNADNKYQVIITLVDNKQIVIKDLSQVQLAKVQESIWSNGWRVRLAPGKWELISPYIMRQVIFEVQKESAGS